MADNENKAKEAKQQAVVYLVQKKIVNPAEQTATIQKVLTETAPALIEADRNAGLSDDEIFLKHADAWFQAHEGVGGGEEKKAAPGHGTKTAPASVNLTSEEQAKLNVIINTNAVAKGQRTAQSHVVAVLTDKPVMSQVFIQGSTLTPVLPADAEEKLRKYESELVDTPENKANFAELKAAWLKKEQLDVYINPKARQKVVGFKVNTLGENNTPETRILTKEEAIVFLACDVNGIIPARDENTLGIKLRWRAKRKADVTANNAAGAPVVAVINAKILPDHPDLSVCTSVVVDNEVNDKFRAKSAKSFLRVSSRKNKNGEPIHVTTRLGGTTRVKCVKRTDEFLPMFGPVGGKKGSGESKRSKEDTRNAVLMTIKSMTEGQLDMQSDSAREAQARIQQQMRGLNNPAGNQSFV